MRIVNPAFGLEEGGDNMSKAVELSTDWFKDGIAIISNSKPNARELLEGVKEQMGVYRSTDNIDYSSKTARRNPLLKHCTTKSRRNIKGRLSL